MEIVNIEPPVHYLKLIHALVQVGRKKVPAFLHLSPGSYETVKSQLESKHKRDVEEIRLLGVRLVPSRHQPQHLMYVEDEKRGLIGQIKIAKPLTLVKD